jgi:hypothetical protein
MSAAFASIFSTTPILVEDNFYEWKRAMKRCFLGAAFTWITDDANAIVLAAKVTEDGQAALFIYLYPYSWLSCGRVQWSRRWLTDCYQDSWPVNRQASLSALWPLPHAVGHLVP